MPSKTEIVPLEGKTLKSYPQHNALNYRRPPEILSGRERISSANLSAINLATDVFPRRLSRAGSAPETFTFFNRETNRNAPSPLFCSFKPFHEKTDFSLRRVDLRDSVPLRLFSHPLLTQIPCLSVKNPLKPGNPPEFRASRVSNFSYHLITCSNLR